jgi:hypothetical protein
VHVKKSKPITTLPDAQVVSEKPRTRNPYRRYVDAKCLPSPGVEYSREAVAGMQLAMLDMLRSGEAIPEEMRLHLTLAFEYICAGVEFDLVTPIKTAGGREPPILKHTQEGGIRYLRWCEDKRIIDPSPISTVATAYQVGTRTVRNWYAKWGSRATPPLLEDFLAEHVVSFMRASGKHYQRFKASSKPKRKT